MKTLRRILFIYGKHKNIATKVTLQCEFCTVATLHTAHRNACQVDTVTWRGVKRLASCGELYTEHAITAVYFSKKTNCGI